MSAGEFHHLGLELVLRNDAVDWAIPAEETERTVRFAGFLPQ